MENDTTRPEEKGNREVEFIENRYWGKKEGGVFVPAHDNTKRPTWYELSKRRYPDLNRVFDGN